MDANVVAFVAVACLGTGIVFGCMPALHLSRRATPLALWDGGRRVGGGAGAGRFMRVLLGAQIAVAVVLLAGAVTLVGRSAALRRADQIVQPHAVLTARVALPADGFQPGAARGRFVAMLLDRLRAIPGVTAASAATTLPFIGAASATLEREGDLDANAGPSVCTIGASPGYFETLSLAFRAGRRPLAAERDVVVINEALAAIVGERGEVIGQRVRLRRPAAGISTPWLTVTGVVPSVRQTPMGDPRPCVYLLLELEPGLNLALLLRAGGDAVSLAADLRRAFAAVAGDLALYNVSTLEEVSHNVRWAPRTVSMVLSIFGMVAFTLSMAGVYAVTASGVAQRTHELGVRLALGAARRHVVGLVAGRVAPSLAIGLLLGLAGGVGLRQMLRGVLIGQNGGSPASLVFIALAVLMVVAAACSVPLRRALGIDPARTLRAE
jgi:putative ABC transport system permease protein